MTDLLASLTHFTIPCPEHMTQFVLNPRFLEGVAANYDALVTPGDSDVAPGDEPCLEVIVSKEYREVLTSLVAARMQVSTNCKPEASRMFFVSFSILSE